ncbi:DoxX family protein [Sphingosinicella soli]|uniref:DoxX family protein n=1 Tax=Sphingosinicella soli TaxID=333708 RepID=A0A7W7F875_9SPHN|nr:DoxX family protein [Sphingosinicella soli]MBB4633382.1 hypothetical protein [Sphingosinicella soli]
MAFEAVQHMITLLLAAAFAGGAVVNLVGPQAVRAAYAQWGYPAGFHYVTALLDAAAAALMLWPDGRVYGIALAMLITLAAFGTLGWHGEWKKTPGCIVFIGALVAALL